MATFQQLAARLGVARCVLSGAQHEFHEALSKTQARSLATLLDELTLNDQQVAEAMRLLALVNWHGSDGKAFSEALLAKSSVGRVAQARKATWRLQDFSAFPDLMCQPSWAILLNQTESSGAKQTLIISWIARLGGRNIDEGTAKLATAILLIATEKWEALQHMEADDKARRMRTFKDSFKRQVRRMQKPDPWLHALPKSAELLKAEQPALYAQNYVDAEPVKCPLQWKDVELIVNSFKCRGVQAVQKPLLQLAHSASFLGQAEQFGSVMLHGMQTMQKQQSQLMEHLFRGNGMAPAGHELLDDNATPRPMMLGYGGGGSKSRASSNSSGSGTDRSERDFPRARLPIMDKDTEADSANGDSQNGPALPNKQLALMSGACGIAGGGAADGFPAASIKPPPKCDDAAPALPNKQLALMNGACGIAGGDAPLKSSASLMHLLDMRESQAKAMAKKRKADGTAKKAVVSTAAASETAERTEKPAVKMKKAPKKKRKKPLLATTATKVADPAAAAAAALAAPKEKKNKKRNGKLGTAATEADASGAAPAAPKQKGKPPTAAVATPVKSPACSAAGKAKKAKQLADAAAMDTTAMDASGAAAAPLKKKGKKKGKPPKAAVAAPVKIPACSAGEKAKKVSRLSPEPLTHGLVVSKSEARLELTASTKSQSRVCLCSLKQPGRFRNVDAFVERVKAMVAGGNATKADVLDAKREWMADQ